MKALKTTLTLLSAASFGFLFWHETVGINLVFFEVLLLIVCFLVHKEKIYSGYASIFLFGTLISLVAYIFNSSANALVLNFISLLLLNAMLTFPYQSIVSMLLQSVANLLSGIIGFFYSFSISTNDKQNKTAFWKYVRLALIPLLVVMLFFTVYRGASPFFNAFSISFVEKITRFFKTIFNYINADFFWIFVFGLVIVSAFLYQNRIHSLALNEAKNKDDIERKKSGRKYFKKTALLNEYRSGIMLFISLNALILLFNILDIYNVWLNFEWKQDFLKQFVHEGTYLLILALGMSIVVVLYFFRENINFYSKNLWIKRLAYIWIFQNGIMVISVGIRNFYYINYFALAYLRIGVILFLIASLVGLFLVYIKVRDRKTTSFLIRKNLISLYIILVINGPINWDVIIAKYNFTQYDKSFVHLDFMAQLSDKALPYLKREMNELEEIEKVQAELFFSDESSIMRKAKFMTKEEYAEKIDLRIKEFYKKRQKLTWLSWTYADQEAFEYCEKTIKP